VNALVWTAYPNPPWERYGVNRMAYGATFERSEGRRSWLVVEKRCSRRTWEVLFVPIAYKPPLAWRLFETRRLAAAKLLAELWASTRRGGRRHE